MPTLTARSIVNKAKIIVQDNTGVRYPDSEFLGWCNQAQRDVVAVKPDAYVKNVPVQLVAGTKQSLPADGTVLVDVKRNMGADGTTAGKTIRMVPQGVLDALNPDWHTTAASATGLHYVFDKRDPKHYYVYPPQPATGMGYVEIIHSATPTDCTLAEFDGVSTGEVDSVIALDDAYESPLLDLMLYRAYSKDSKYAGNAGRAAAHRAAALEALGVKEAAETATEPVDVTSQAG